MPSWYPEGPRNLRQMAQTWRSGMGQEAFDEDPIGTTREALGHPRLEDRRSRAGADVWSWRCHPGRGPTRSLRRWPRRSAGHDRLHRRLLERGLLELERIEQPNDRSIARQDRPAERAGAVVVLSGVRLQAPGEPPRHDLRQHGGQGLVARRQFGHAPAAADGRQRRRRPGLRRRQRDSFHQVGSRRDPALVGRGARERMAHGAGLRHNRDGGQVEPVPRRGSHRDGLVRQHRDHTRRPRGDRIRERPHVHRELRRRGGDRRQRE